MSVIYMSKIATCKKVISEIIAIVYEDVVSHEGLLHQDNICKDESINKTKIRPGNCDLY